MARTLFCISKYVYHIAYDFPLSRICFPTIYFLIFVVRLILLILFLGDDAWENAWFSNTHIYIKYIKQSQKLQLGFWLDVPSEIQLRWVLARWRFRPHQDCLIRIYKLHKFTFPSICCWKKKSQWKCRLTTFSAKEICRRKRAHEITAQKRIFHRYFHFLQPSITAFTFAFAFARALAFFFFCFFFFEAPALFSLGFFFFSGSFPWFW